MRGFQPDCSCKVSEPPGNEHETEVASSAVPSTTFVSLVRRLLFEGSVFWTHSEDLDNVWGKVSCEDIVKLLLGYFIKVESSTGRVKP